MLRNYLRTALRVLRRHPSYTAINLAGLSIGIAASFLLLLFVKNEITFDQKHENADRIYRAWVLEDYGEDQQFFNTTTPVPLGPGLQANLPEIETFVRFDRLTNTVRKGDTSLNETLFMVDPEFLSVFDFPAILGNPEQMFTNPDAIVLTESAARRYFENDNPLGETLTIEFGEDLREFEVTGVLADVPENSSLQFEMLLSYAVTDWFYSDRMKQAWMNVSPETYVMLREGVEISSVEAKLPAVVNQLLGDRVEEGQYQVGLQPLLDIHMNPEIPQGYAPVINPFYVRILLGVALLILAIACINFVTLTISRSTARSREIGIRKVVGAGRSQLMRQYWGEAMLMTGISIGIGLVLARALLPAFNELSTKSLSLTFEPITLVMILGLFGVISLVAGLYPAVVLSGLNPHHALYGKSDARLNRGRLRKGLVVIQFSLAILLMVSTFVMGNQLRFLENKDLGFTPESVLVIPTEIRQSNANDLVERLRFATARNDEVISLTSSIMLFDINGWGRIGYNATDGTYKRFYANVIDHEFVETLGLRLKEGRDFSPDQPGDLERGMLINESFSRAYGWEDPLSETIPGNFDEHEIIGVVEDFHYASLHTDIQPAVMVVNSNVVFSGASDFDYGASTAAKIAIRIRTDDLQSTIKNLEIAWAEAAPDLPFSYSFLDDSISSQYVQEERLSDVTMLGALLAIFTAGLGLFGLAAMSVARRTKEIGLRKVLGASITTIVQLFIREFSLLMGIAFVLAVPLAYFGMSEWLEAFAYRTSIGVLPFVLAGIGAALVMWVAVGFQSLRAALANPVDALRDE